MIVMRSDLQKNPDENGKSAQADTGSSSQPAAPKRRGRPRGSKNRIKTDGLTESEQLALEESRRIVQQESQLTAFQVVARAQIKTAVNGGTNAQKSHLERIAKLEQKQLDARAKRLDEAEHYVRIAEYALEIATPERRSKLESFLLPHPHDVEVDYDKGVVRVRGPATTLERREWNRHKEDLAWVRQTVLDLRIEVELDPANEAKQVDMMWFFHMYLNCIELLPERHRPEPLPSWASRKMIPWWFDRETEDALF